MGNAQSPAADPRFVTASRAFTPKELEDLKTVFASLAAQSQSNGEFVSESVFQEYYGLKGPLGSRLFNQITQKRKDQRLTFKDLVIAKGSYEKGTKDEIEEFIYQLLDVNGDGLVLRSDLEYVLTTIFDCILSLESSEPKPSTKLEIMDIFLNAATFSNSHEGKDEKSMSFEDFRSWCTLLPSVRKFLGNLLMPSNSGSQVPRLQHPENIDSSTMILKKEYAWHIGGILSHEDLEEWKLLYHSGLHGLSFNTFLGRIAEDEGPTVLIVKDKEGYIYGGYASQPWEKHSDFYGDMKSSIFQLYPKASMFKPSGANNNLQWCAVNFSSESIPNGIGFGGKVHHFGLFLSASFDQGQTFSCSTFGSPCLSKTNRICPDVIECWGIVSKGGQQEKAEALKGTVLERFKEDRNMLKMVGMANSSE